MRAEVDLVKHVIQSDLPLDEKLQMIAAARTSPKTSEEIDRRLVTEIGRLRQGLDKVRIEQEKLRETLRKTTQPPLFPAVFVGAVESGLMVVLPGGGRRVVHGADGVEVDELRPGDEVLLNPELHQVMGLSGGRGSRGGEVGTFDRHLDETRIVVRSRDEEVALDVAGGLRNDGLTAGDMVRFDRGMLMAFERLPRSAGERFLAKEPPKATFADIGGLDAEIEEMRRLVTLQFFHPGAAARYGVAANGAMLLAGPPGTGKTMLAGAIAHWIGEISGAPARMISVRPGEWRSQWYGESERYLREMFGAARSAGEKDRRAPVVVFFDELDSIGTTRGRAGSAVDDRVLQAFAAELDGVLSQRNHNILMIGATNRRESLDPALLRPGRFGDKEIRVGRPGMSAARAILAKHLTPGINYALNGSGGPSATRDHIIDATVSRLYAPNGESDLCSLIFRDGSQRPVKPADLMSGASLAKIAHAARERACWREVTTHSQGVRIEDLFAAVDRELDRLSRILTPANAREHLVGLPDDLDVVKVERSGPRHARGRLKYLTISGA